jgi:hypothetical protein
MEVKRKIITVTSLLGLVGGLTFSLTTAASAAPAAPYPCNQFPNAGLCAVAKTAVHMRTNPHTNASIIATVPAGQGVNLVCWAYGDSVNGDNIWYYGPEYPFEGSPPNDPTGYVSGEYMDTGHDPAPGVGQCS